MEQEHEKPGFSHASALLAAFLVPVLIGLLAVFLGGCNPAASDDPPSPGKPVTFQDSLVGTWFPCETIGSRPEWNSDCRLVLDEGVTFTPGSRVEWIDGPVWYDKAVRKSQDRDSLGFDIGAKKVYGYLTDSADFSLRGDTMAYRTRDRWTHEMESHEDVVKLEGDFLTVRVHANDYRPMKFRKYSGTLRVVSVMEYTRILRDMQGP